MTRDRRSKQAVRARMAESGLKYTEARRQIIDADGGDHGGGDDVDVGFDRPEDVIGYFSDQAYNLVLLAEDEARMLGRGVVEPEHLLLAFARRGNAQRLLEIVGVSAGDLHSAIVSRFGVGKELVLGRVQRSDAANGVLRAAVLEAASRGLRGLSSEHVLLALDRHPTGAALLSDFGVVDLRAVIDERYPSSGPAIDPQQALMHAQRLSARRQPPRPGPVPPVFERYTDDARAVIERAEAIAAELGHACVEPFHFLIGCALVPDTAAQGALLAEGVTHEAAWERARLHGPAPAEQPTGIFSDEAREIVAEDALAVSHRAQAPAIDTQHVLLATLNSEDSTVPQIVGIVAATQRIADRLRRDLAAGDD